MPGGVGRVGQLSCLPLSRFLPVQETGHNLEQSIGLMRQHCSRLSKTKGACSAMHGVMGFVIIGCCIGAVIAGFVMLALDLRRNRRGALRREKLISRLGRK